MSYIVRRYMALNKLFIASSTTLQISATLHKLLPVHPTGHICFVYTFLMWEKLTQVVSYQQLTACGANRICTVLS